MDTKKRINFSQRDKETLLCIVAKYKHIIEDKCTKAFMTDKKNKAWTAIERDFNCSSETGPRTVKQLKVLYENLKRETKKNVAKQHHENYEVKLIEHEAKRAANNDKREIFKTGGGTAEVVLTNEQDILLASIRDSIEPLENPFDGAAEYFSNLNTQIKNTSSPL